MFERCAYTITAGKTTAAKAFGAENRPVILKFTKVAIPKNTTAHMEASDTILLAITTTTHTAKAIDVSRGWAAIIAPNATLMPLPPLKPK